MFYSRFIPVDIKRSNCTVYSNTNNFPIKYLKKVVECVRDNATYDNIEVSDNNITVSDVNEEGVLEVKYTWTLPEVYMAWEAYEVAVKSDFCFHRIINADKVPQLFVSDITCGCRILVSTFTMQSLIITDTKLVKKLGDMIDHVYDNMYCLNLFNMLVDLNTGRNNYIYGLIVMRGEPDEAMIVNPILTQFTDSTTVYGADILEEYRLLANNVTTETDRAKRVGKIITRTDLSFEMSFPLQHVKNILKLYDDLKTGKSNYVEILNNDFSTDFYISTNVRYMVDAHTFEIVEVVNERFRKALSLYVNGCRPAPSEIKLLWDIAKNGVRR